jgi:hypothetical protein
MFALFLLALLPQPFLDLLLAPAVSEILAGLSAHGAHPSRPSIEWPWWILLEDRPEVLELMAGCWTR